MQEDTPTEDEVVAWVDMENHLKRFGRTGRKPHTLKAVINRVMATRGYNQRQRNQAIEDAWRETVPKQWMAHCRLGKVTRGTLSIVVDHSAVLQQLTFSKPQLLQKLNEKLAGTTIKNLRFTLG